MPTVELDDEVCECGTPLSTHPPLPKPGPLKSWKATKNSDEKLSAHARLGREASYWSNNMAVSKKATRKPK